MNNCKCEIIFQDLVRKLLVLDPKDRMTAAQALEHPWVQGAAKSTSMETTQKKIKEFNARRKMKVNF